jgi:glycosyltransferase involved in cell wall biosynthesis
MRLLIIAPFDSLSVHSIRWVERLLSQNINCYVVSMSRESFSLQNPNFHLLSLPSLFQAKKLIKKFPIIRSLLDIVELVVQIFYFNRLIRINNFDLINIQWLYNGAGYAATFQKKVPIVSTPWGSDLLMPSLKGKGFSKSKTRFINRILVNRIVRRSSAFTCDANHMKEALVKRGANPAQVSLIYFGTDVEYFNSNFRSQDLREHLGVGESTVMILSNRTLEAIYDISTLFRAIARLKEFKLDLRFVIAGGGSMRTDFEELVSSLGIQDLVVFTGRVDDETFRNLVASTDIYVSTSPTDGGIAASVAEAMSCEKPVIVTNFGDNSHWLKNQTAGLLFSSGNDEELCEKILTLVKNPDLRSRMGKIGREIVVMDNNSKIEVEKVVNLFQRVSQSY